MTYRATRLLRLPGRMVQVGETVRKGEVPPYRLGSYLRTGLLVDSKARTYSKPKEPQVVIEDEPVPTTEE